MARHRYLLALGSNVRHHRYGRPRDVVRAALSALEAAGLDVESVSPVLRTAPLGPSRRRFANAAAVISAGLDPPDLLDRLQRIEISFGRSRRGMRWRERVLDIDIVLWSGGHWASEELVIPHVAFRERDFVLAPATAIAPSWRDPVSGLTVQHLHARLTRHRPIPR